MMMRRRGWRQRRSRQSKKKDYDWNSGGSLSSGRWFWSADFWKRCFSKDKKEEKYRWAIPSGCSLRQKQQTKQEGDQRWAESLVNVGGVRASRLWPAQRYFLSSSMSVCSFYSCSPFCPGWTQTTSCDHLCMQGEDWDGSVLILLWMHFLFPKKRMLLYLGYVFR